MPWWGWLLVAVLAVWLALALAGLVYLVVQLSHLFSGL